MNIKFCGSVVAAALAIGLLGLPVISVGQNAEQKSRLDELLRERRDVLQQVVEVVTNEYRSGNKSFDSVVQAQDRLIDAELELVNSHQQRLALLRQQVEMFEALSDAVEQRFLLGHGTQADTLGARAAVLDAKIELVREQNKSGKSSD